MHRARYVVVTSSHSEAGELCCRFFVGPERLEPRAMYASAGNCAGLLRLALDFSTHKLSMRL